MTARLPRLSYKTLQLLPGSHSGGSQQPCGKDVQGALQRGLSGLLLTPNTNLPGR